MLIFIENTPRAYAWGSRDALPELLGVEPNGEPQAELWLGDHPGAPASVAKARPGPQTLIELIESDPELYGVDGGHLPFLMKVLAIGAPLSLQVHPDKTQSEAGFAREEAAGVPLDARERNYGDPNHKPEMLVALSEVSALCGFRALDEVCSDLLKLASCAPPGAGREALEQAAQWCRAGSSNEAAARSSRSMLLQWALCDPANEGREAVAAIAEALPRLELPLADPGRTQALRDLISTHPGDPGVLVSLLLHLVTLRPGEAVYLGPRQLHAYLGGIAIEVMAASDNVLRAGLTEKHIDVAELMSIVDTGTLESPRIAAYSEVPGLIGWQPPVPDFTLMRATLGGASAGDSDERIDEDAPGSVLIEAPYPLVLVVMRGRVRVERLGSGFSEFANVAKGQSLYVSAGDPIELSGHSQVFIATVGADWPRVSKPSSGT